MLKLKDSLSGDLRKFETIDLKEVSMYVCGVTPYSTNHIAHIYVFTIFDTLIRYLKYLGYTVNYVQNVTDVDAPLFKKARQEGRNWRELADYWIDYMLNDFEVMNIAMPDHFVKASATIDEMIDIVRKLVKDGYAYESGGNVYFDTKRFPAYGEMLALPVEKLEERSRGEDVGNITNDRRKRNPLDFPLWVTAEISADEPIWPSPWGEGQPGWHIECSAMINKYLGKRIDIHGGGADLKFPHHSAEIAQMESYSGTKPFVNYWLHCGPVHFEGAKMSKSKGNLVSVQDLLAQGYSAQALRYYLLKHHYRQQWEFSFTELDKANSEWVSFSQRLDDYPQGISDSLRPVEVTSHMQAFLDNDFDIPSALDYLINRPVDEYTVQAMQIIGIAPDHKL
jgi:cysteinyl-tRNA synthetase